MLRYGNRTDGLSVYQTLRTRFRDELGVEPGESTQQLFRRLLN